MRHQIFGRKLNRNYNQRKALFKALLASLIKNKRIITTEAKAKAIRGLIDKTVNQVKNGSLSKRREIIKLFPNEEIVNRLFKEIGPALNGRKGGYTRIIKLKERKGDGAKMVVLEWVVNLKEIKKEVKEEGKKTNKN